MLGNLRRIGYHVTTHLADQGYNVYAFNAGGTPLDSSTPRQRRLAHYGSCWKKRGQSSPDRAEALVLAFARVVPRQQTIVWTLGDTQNRPVGVTSKPAS